MGILLSLIPVIVKDFPILIDTVRSLINTAHQNSELTDEDHAKLMAAFIKKAQEDPAWKPTSDS